MAYSNIALIRCHPADVIRILRHQIRIQVVKSAAHLIGVLLVYAKDDGLGIAIGIPHELRQMACDGLSTRPQSDDPLEILGLVLAVWNLVAEAILHALRRPPARSIHIRDNAMDPVRRQESVLNSLPQAVGVNRVAKIVIGIPVVVSQRGGRHSQLVSGLEIFQNFAPVALIPGAAPVALVYYYQVEEIRLVLPEEARTPLILGQRLVDGKVHLPALDCLAVFDRPAGISKGRKGLVLGIIDEYVSVCQIEDAWPALLVPRVPSRFP